MINSMTGYSFTSKVINGVTIEIEIKSLPKCLEITHVSLFDQSIEGFRHKTLPIFSVQYHPEASPGPTESSYLFEEFLNLIKLNVNNAKT